MTDDVVPEDVKQFLLEHFDSIAQWEGLLLFRSNPEEQWGVDAIAKRLYISEADAGKILADLTQQNFLIPARNEPGLYQYGPKSPDLERMIGRVAELYSRYLVPITNLIHSKPKTRIQEFADAFRIRKD